MKTRTGPRIRVRVVLDKDISRPWEILWGPDNHIWMTERGGRISRVDPKTGELKPLLTLPDIVASGGNWNLLRHGAAPGLRANATCVHRI